MKLVGIVQQVPFQQKRSLVSLVTIAHLTLRTKQSAPRALIKKISSKRAAISLTLGSTAPTKA